MSSGNRVITCRCCERPGSNHGRGWIPACYARWVRAGRPASGPPPAQPRRLAAPWIPKRVRGVGTLADFQFLRSCGVADLAVLAARLGVTVRHVERLARADRVLRRSLVAKQHGSRRRSATSTRPPGR